MQPETNSLFYTQNGSTDDPFQSHGLNPIHRVSDTPGIYGSFESTEQFRINIRLALSKILDDFDSNNKLASLPSASNEVIRHPQSSYGISNPLDQLLSLVDDDDTDASFFDLSDRLIENSDKVVGKLATVSALVEKLTADTKARTHDLNELAKNGLPNKNAVANVLNKVSGNMELFVSQSERDLPPLRDSLEDYIDSFQKFILTVGVNNPGNQTEKASLKENIGSMLANMETAYESFEGLSRSTLALPRMTKDVNRSKRRVSAIADGIAQMLKSAHLQLEVIFDAFHAPETRP